MRDGEDEGIHDLSTANGILAAWIDLQPTRPPEATLKKQGAAAKRLAEKFKPEEVFLAMAGIGTLFPHNGGTPWDLFTLEKKFAVAFAAAQAPVEQRELTYEDDGRPENPMVLDGKLYFGEEKDKKLKEAKEKAGKREQAEEKRRKAREKVKKVRERAEAKRARGDSHV